MDPSAPSTDAQNTYRRALVAYRAAVADGTVRPPSPPAIDMHPMAVALRRAWWHLGYAHTTDPPRHYPTCPCKTCAARDQRETEATKGKS